MKTKNILAIISAVLCLILFSGNEIYANDQIRDNDVSSASSGNEIVMVDDSFIYPSKAAGIPKLDEEKTDPVEVKSDIAKAKENLSKVINEAKGLEKNDYTEDSFKALQDALDEAEKTLKDENATAESLNKAIDSIIDAELALVEKAEGTDNNTNGTNPGGKIGSLIIEKAKAAISEKIENAKNIAKEKYTDESYKILEDAISAAEDVLAKENAKAEELKKTAESVETAINNLEEKKAKEEAEKKAATEARDALNNNIAEAKKIEQGNYTDESYKTLQDAISEAEKLAADPNATSEQLKAANTKIEEAKNALAEKPDPAKQFGKDGTPAGPGASREAAEAAIAGMTDDSDLPGAIFNRLQLKSKKQTNTSISLSWKKVSGAKKYVIYGNKCGKKKKLKKLTTVKAKDTKTYTRTFKKVLGKKVKKGTYYKFMIIALDKDNKVVSSSKIIHVATKGGKVGNVSKVTTKAKKNKVTIKRGKTFKLAGKQVAASKKLKVKVHRKVSYESSNPKIAKVSKKGVITGKKKGTCYVYAYAQNGVFAKIKVTVK